MTTIDEEWVELLRVGPLPRDHVATEELLDTMVGAFVEPVSVTTGRDYWTSAVADMDVVAKIVALEVRHDDRGAYLVGLMRPSRLTGCMLGLRADPARRLVLLDLSPSWIGDGPQAGRILDVLMNNAKASHEPAVPADMDLEMSRALFGLEAYEVTEVDGEVSRRSVDPKDLVIARSASDPDAVIGYMHRSDPTRLIVIDSLCANMSPPPGVAIVHGQRTLAGEMLVARRGRELLGLPTYTEAGWLELSKARYVAPRVDYKFVADNGDAVIRYHREKTKYGRAPRSTKPDRNGKARAKILAKGTP